MIGREILDRIQKHIPVEDSWVKEPYGPNKLFDLNKNYERILYCVTPSIDVQYYFLENGYDLLISHHPFDSHICPQIILHTALDCCRGGLNDIWAELLGVKNGANFDKNLGIYGAIEPISFENLILKIETFTSHPIKGQYFSKKDKIKSVVICTGYGGLVYNQALATGADCYILGENTCGNHGFEAMIEVGHTLTERCGATKLEEVLGFKIDLAPLELDVFGTEVLLDRIR